MENNDNECVKSFNKETQKWEIIYGSEKSTVVSYILKLENNPPKNKNLIDKIRLFTNCILGEPYKKH